MADAEHDDPLAGLTVELAEPDYAYGIGSLRLRITRTSPTRWQAGWLLVDGVRVDAEGIERETHTVGVRLDVLRPHVASAAWRALETIAAGDDAVPRAPHQNRAPAEPAPAPTG